MVVAYGCRNTKKLLCGIEGKDVVAYGRLSSPARFVCVCGFKIVSIDER